MLLWARRVFDVKAGEGLPVALTFVYIALVVCAFLLAKPIRNALFLKQYGPYALVYVYAAVPAVLAVFVPIYSRIAARFGSRVVAIATLLFFSTERTPFLVRLPFSSVLAAAGHPVCLGQLLRHYRARPGVEPDNALFDTRQAKRLFGLIGSGASLGAIAGGMLARFLVEPVGGAVNLLLVLAFLIMIAAVLVSLVSVRRIRGRVERTRQVQSAKVRDTWREIAATPYLRQIAAVVFLMTIATQWTAFQLSLMADRRFGGSADDLTEFFGTFNVMLGIFSFLVQLFATGRLLRNFGVGVTLLVLPYALAGGNALILLFPAFWSVLVTNAFDQGLRFSVDKATLRAPVSADCRRRPRPCEECHRDRPEPASPMLLVLSASGWRRWDSSSCPASVSTSAASPPSTLSARHLDRRRLAASRRLRSHDSREHPSAPHRHRASALGGVDLSAAAALRASSAPPIPRSALRAGADRRCSRAELASLTARCCTHPEADIRRRALALLSAGR